MKFFQISFWLLFFGVVPNVTEAQTSNHKITVTNLKNKKGKLLIGWYNSEKSYNERNNPVFKKSVDVDKRSEISVVFENIPPGKYAVSMFLDENGNNKMDTNLLGIPKEQYGFSNNILPATRAANFKEASFEVPDKPSEISIRLK